MWQGEEYIVKMYTDLDFVVDVLGAYAARIGCFSKQNPLLLTKADLTGVGSRPDLARIYGALLILLDVIARHRRKVASPDKPVHAMPDLNGGGKQPKSVRVRTDDRLTDRLHNTATNGEEAPDMPTSPPRPPAESIASEIEEEAAEPAAAVVVEEEEEQEPEPVVPEPEAADHHHHHHAVPGESGMQLRGEEMPEQNRRSTSRSPTTPERLEASQSYEEDDFDAENSADASAENPPPVPQQQAEKAQESVQYEMVRELGRGAFAQVWECDVHGHGKVAVKFLQHDDDDDEETIEYVKRAWGQELRLLQELKHPNVIEFVVAVSHPKHGVGIGCEVAECNLLTVVEGWHGKNAIKYAVLASEVLLQVGSALEYVHDRNLVRFWWWLM